MRLLPFVLYGFLGAIWRSFVEWLCVCSQHHAHVCVALSVLYLRSGLAVPGSPWFRFYVFAELF